jgi:hypothetical protein
LAADSFAKSSDPFCAWLLGHKHFGAGIKNYREKGRITGRTRVIALSLLWLSISLSTFKAIFCWTARAVLSAVAGAATFHLLSLKNSSLTT